MEKFDILDVVRRYCSELEKRALAVESSISVSNNDELQNLRKQNEELKASIAEKEMAAKDLAAKIESMDMRSAKSQLAEISSWIMDLRHKSQDTKHRKELQDLASKIGKMING
jgi:hypothetical protein